MLLTADVSQFYPSLYTHAVAWAINPKARNNPNWNKKGSLAADTDRALRNANARITQGIPIGNDISFLLAEIVLARVDKAVRFPKERAYRWFDDYEVAFDTQEQAEAGLAKLRRELGSFKLRLNPVKTKISVLPAVTQESWQERLRETARAKFLALRDMVTHFDAAFRLRNEHPDSPVLLYAMGALFKIICPKPPVARVAESCITQALLSEPGAAQKGFALLSFWRLNGLSLNTDLIKHTIDRIILRHQWKGASSDVAWALAFCLEQQIPLSKSAAKVLSRFDDDSIVLQALDLHAAGLLPEGFSTKGIEKLIKNADLDGEHWLLSYEALRQGFLTASASAVSQHQLFSDLLAKKVTFYRRKLPRYASVIHPGGAPVWTIQVWIDQLRTAKQTGEAILEKPGGEVFALIEKDIARLASPSATVDEELEGLLNIEMKEAGEAPEIPEQSDAF